MKLHKHQERGVRHLTLNDRAGLFLPVGSGKTLTTLAALTPAHLPVLVVAPKQVCEHVWPAEVAKWRPELSVALAAGTAAKRKAAIEQRADITVISRDNLADLIKPNGREPAYHFSTVVLDESQSFKNNSAQRWKLVRKLTTKAAHVWELTGTPAGNGLADLWAQVSLLDGNERLGNKGQFMERYFTSGVRLPNGAVIKRELKRGAETSIYRAIEDICLHIPLDDLDLPDLVINPVPVGLPPSARKVYDALKEDMIIGLDLIGETMTVPSAGVLSSKLQQVTAGAVFGETTDDGERGTLHELHAAKLDELESIVEQTEGNVLVFYKFTFEADRMLKRFKQATHIKASGAIDAWNRKEIPILLAHPRSAGAGLNLQHGGSTIVWSTLSFSSEDWIQGNGRLHRQGQTNRVMVHVLTAPDTVDEHAIKVVQGKVSMQQALLDALT